MSACSADPTSQVCLSPVPLEDLAELMPMPLRHNRSANRQRMISYEKPADQAGIESLRCKFLRKSLPVGNSRVADRSTVAFLGHGADRCKYRSPGAVVPEEPRPQINAAITGH